MTRGQTESRTIQSSVGELRPLSRWARAIAKREGCAPGVCDDLDLCLNEAVTNVILHGYGKDSRGAITVGIEPVGTTLRVSIEDDAPPFDPTGAPLPGPVPLERAGPRGRGLVLIRRLTPAVRYERRGGRNRLTLEFEMGGAP